VEETDLAERRSAIRYLEHQPLDRFVAGCAFASEILAALVGELDQDRAGLE